MKESVQVTIRPIGNSHGVVIPKPLLLQAGLSGGVAEIAVEGGALVLRKPRKSVRSGWAEAAAKVAESGDDALVLGEFDNEGDKELTW